MLTKNLEQILPAALLQSARLFVMVVNFDGTCSYTNGVLRKSYNLSHGFFDGFMAAEKLFMADDVPMFNNTLKKCLQTPDSVFEVITRSACEGIECSHTAWEISAFYNGGSEPVGALCVGHDITRQVKIEREALLKQQMLDSVEQTVIVTDNDNKIIFWNRYAEKLFGWTADEVLGKEIIEFIHPSVVDDAHTILGELKANENSWRGEFMLQNKAGVLFPTYCATSRLQDEDGKTIGLIGLAIDLTEAKKTELMLDENRRRLELLNLIADKTMNAIVMSDENGCAEWVNDGFTRIFGYTPDEIINHRPGEVLCGDASDPMVIKEINDAIKNHKPYDVEIVNYRKNGQPCWIWVQGQPIFHDNGKLRGFLDVVADITEQKEWEEQLLFQAYLLDSVQQAVIVTDNNWDITYWNKYAEKLYGWKQDEIIGKNINVLVSDTSENSVFTEVKQTIKMGLVHSGDITMQKKNGDNFPVHCINSLVHDKGGAPIGCMAVTFDITKQKATESQRKKAAEILLRQYRKLKQFAHINAHDLRAPLTNVLSITHLLTSDYNLTDEERKVYVKGLEDSAKQMDGVVRKLNSVLQGYEMDIDTELFGMINSERRKLAVLVDDDRIQNIVNKKLIVEEFPNYDVLVYTDPEAALKDIIEHTISPDIVFLDLNMPSIDGWEFLEELRDKPVNFDIQILTSSIDQNDFLRAKVTPHVTGVTSKPLQKDLLEAML